MEICEDIEILAEKCAFSGHVLYIVGGRCRDELARLCHGGSEYDLCSSMPIFEFSKAAVQAGFKILSKDNALGYIKAEKGGIYMEFTRFRKDEYGTGHRPLKITFTDSIEEDALRRDFKCSAVYYDISEKQYKDPLGGMEDIQKRIFDTVRDPEEVFQEDGLRLLRLCRQCAETGFSPSERCLKSANILSYKLCELSGFRVRKELEKILLSDTKYNVLSGPYTGLKLLNLTGALEKILPELKKGDGMEQKGPYHDHDVWEHTLRCVAYCPPRGLLRMAALLHDVGKPYCFETSGTFHGHETEGERIARAICERLELDKKSTEKICRMILYHMRDANLLMKDLKLRRFILNNLDIMDDLLALKQADRTACKDDRSKDSTVKKWEAHYNDIKNNPDVPKSVKDIRISADDLKNLGYKGPQIKDELDKIFWQVFDGVWKNDRQYLLEKAEKHINGK